MCGGMCACLCVLLDSITIVVSESSSVSMARGQQCPHPAQCRLPSNRPDASLCHSEHGQSCLPPQSAALSVCVCLFVCMQESLLKIDLF